MSGINPNAVLAKVGSNLDFLKDWSKDNETTFTRVMEQLADESPSKFADIYIRVQTQIAPPKENKTEVNIHVDNDLAKLQALAGTVDKSRRIESQSAKTEYAEFEELSDKSTL